MDRAKQLSTLIKLRAAKQDLRALELKNQQLALLLLEQERRIVQLSKLGGFDEIAGMLVHDLSNPLALIMGRAQQMIRLIGSGQATQEDLAPKAESIEANTKKMVEIVRGMRKYRWDPRPKVHETSNHSK